MEPTHGLEPMLVRALMVVCCVLLSAKVYNRSRRQSLTHTALHAGLVILAAGWKTEVQVRASAKVYAKKKRGRRKRGSLHTGI